MRLRPVKAYADPASAPPEDGPPLTVRPLAQGERTAGCGDRAGEGVSEESVVGTQDVDDAGLRCRLPEVGVAVDQPDYLPWLPVRHQDRRHRDSRVVRMGVCPVIVDGAQTDDAQLLT